MEGSQRAMEVDVAHLMSMIMQFLYENGLHRSLDTLREESGIRWFGSDETVDLINLVERGPTSKILLLPLSTQISSDLYIDIFELILVELLQKKCTATVKHVLEKGRLIEDMKERCPSRLDRLLKLVRGPTETNYWGSVYGSQTEEQVRKRLVQAIRKDLHSSYQLQPSELLMRLGMARSSIPKPVEMPVPENAENIRNTPATLGPLPLISHCFATRSISGLATTDQINAIACSSKGRYLAIGTLHEVIILDSKTLKSTTHFPTISFPGCISLAFSENFLAMVNLEGQVLIIDLIRPTRYKKEDAHRDGALQVIFSRLGDKDILITGGADRSIVIWSIILGQEELNLQLISRIELPYPFDLISMPLPNLIITGGDSRKCFLIEGKIDQNGHHQWSLAGSISLLDAERSLVEPKVSQLVSGDGRTYFVLTTGDVGVIDIVARTSHIVGKVQLRLGINGYCCLLDDVKKALYIADGSGMVQSLPLGLRPGEYRDSTIIATIDGEPTAMSWSSEEANKILLVTDHKRQIHFFK